ncbi:MAG: cobyric acid synthase [Rhodobacteraceae bacterium]|nr:MAG: cobyric acid synthase [Paracoccaceae bacterium]
MPAFMVQGTGSNVGKSLLVAGLCRALYQRGIKVAPFKPQNMSNNAAVTSDGGEIGRAQALQAQACGLSPICDMNPVLLKPESETGSQVIVQGKRFATSKAREYAALKPKLLPYVLDSFERLKSNHDLVIVEGAGSPAEINLRAGDIANMGFSCAANVPVLLVGDIDRGGVIAQLVGTKAVLDPEDEKQIIGFLVNKFRGDPQLFDDGYDMIEHKTGWPGFGVVPYFADAWKLPAEDALDISTPHRSGKPHIVCLGLSRIANFDDLDPLSNDPDLRVTILKAGQTIPVDASLVIVPGSKSTTGDLDYLRLQGWDIDLLAHHRRGGYVLGICGGYQMLGALIDDPEGIEGAKGVTEGLGLLNTKTVMKPKKALTEVVARHQDTGSNFSGYEIHIGQTSGPDCARPFASIGDVNEGAISEDGRIFGSYLHGMFSDDDFRRSFLGQMGIAASQLSYAESVEITLDDLAQHIELYIDLDRLVDCAR